MLQIKHLLERYGLVYGSFYYGTAIGYIDENNVFQSVLSGSLTGGYTGPNQTGLYYPEGSPQRENYERQVSYYNAHLELVNRFGLTNQSYIHRQYTSYVNVWVKHSIHHHGSFESWTSSPKKPGFILRQDPSKKFLLVFRQGVSTLQILVNQELLF